MKTDKAAEPLLRVDNLTKYFVTTNGFFSRTTRTVKAVDGVSFAISPGETLGLVGESGCGKSTIAKMIVELEKPSSGQILFDGRELHGRTPWKQHEKLSLQIIFQDPFSSLNPRKRVGDILREPILYHRLAQGNAVDLRVGGLLEMVGIPPSYAGRYPHEFSGGQRQRIVLARSLAVNPRLIVCDEPVSALDVSIQAQILNLLKDLQKELRLTYLFIAHGLGAVRYISDRLAVMYLGRIVEMAKTEELFRRPLHPYSKALIDSSPVANPHRRDRQRIVLEGEISSAARPDGGCSFYPRCSFA